jgi:hypothetical protein
VNFTFRVSNATNVLAKTSAADDVATDPLLLDVMEGVLGKGVWLSCAHAKNPLPGAGPAPRPHTLSPCSGVDI